MDILGFHILFNSILVITGPRVGYSERLCAMDPCLQLKRFPLPAELKPRTARSAGQRLTY